MSYENRPYFTQEHQIFRDTVRKFAEKELLPHQKKWENGELAPKTLFQKLGEMGLIGVNYPKAYGGSDLDLWYKVAMYEELTYARMNGLVMDIIVQTDIATPIINEIGTEEQKQEFLVPAIKGEKIGALGVTEPGAGSDVAHMITHAKREGDDYVINGSKLYITNGNRADFITLGVRTGPQLKADNFKEGAHGISLLLFPTKDENGQVRKGFKALPLGKKLGNHSSDTAQLFFEDCRVPAKYLLGEENKGFYYIMQNFQGERLHAAVSAVANCQQLLEDAYRYGEERNAFGKKINHFQVWKHKFADLATETEAARELTYRAVDLFNRKIPCLKEISMAKLFSTELVNKIANEVLQFHGGYGYTEECDIARIFRDVRLINIGGGSSQIMKEIIAKCIGY